MRNFSFAKGKVTHCKMPHGADGHFPLQNTWVYFVLFCDTLWISWEKNDFILFITQCRICIMLLAINRAFLKLAPKGGSALGGLLFGECLAP
jgi:hypothetical protein